MTPIELQAWIAVAQALIPIGVQLGAGFKALIKDLHPNALTDAQIDQAFDAILADDGVRAALAHKAAGG